MTRVGIGAASAGGWRERALARMVDRVVGCSRLGILMYHGVVRDPLPVDDWCFLSADAFERQMRWLAGLPVDVLPLVEAVQRLTSGRLRRPAIAVTFDDGYRNTAEVAVPMLAQLRLPATVFLATGRIGTRRGLWTVRVTRAVIQTARTELSYAGEHIDLRGRRARADAVARLHAIVKRDSGADPDLAATEIETALGADTDPDFSADPSFSMMSPASIRSGGTGLIDFGAHTVNHPILSRLDDERLASEIDGSVAAVQALTGRPCRTFAYPNGGSADFDARAVQRLRQLGIVAAVTTQEGLNRAGGDPLLLRRWHVGARITESRFRAKVRALDLRALMAG